MPLSAPPPEQTLDILVERVLARISELGADGQTGGVMESRVGDELRYATRWVCERAPIEALYRFAKRYDPDVITDDEDKLAYEVLETVTYLEIPSEVWRFVRMKLTGWTQPWRGSPLAESEAPGYNAGVLKGRLETRDVPSAVYPRVALTMHNFGPGSVASTVTAYAPGIAAGAFLAPALACYPKITFTIDSDEHPADDDGNGEWIYISRVSPELLTEPLADAACWDAAGRLLRADKDYAYLAPSAERRRDEVLIGLKVPQSNMTVRRASIY